MKTTKKVFALLLSVVMVLTMALTAFAAEDGDNAKLTITNRNEEATYTAYKVMSATRQKADDKGNYVFTYSVTDEFARFFVNNVDGYSLNNDNEILKDGEVITTDGLKNTNSSAAAALASALAKYARDNKISGTNVTTDGLDTAIGYYVVAETATKGAVVASKPMLVNLTKDVEVTTKKSNIDLEKKIVEGDKRLDSNTANIGDDVKYEVKSSIPTYEANVDKDKLSYVLTDTFTNLIYNKDAVIKVGDDVLTKDKDYTITEENGKFVLSLMPETIFAHQGDDVVLTYSAKLSENAVVDDQKGNPNNIKLEYTNNPNVIDSKGTLEDEVKTYTFGLNIHKVDKNDDTKDMAGAAFEVKDNATGKVIGTFEYGKDGNITNPTGLVITKDGNIATIKGLKDGEYTITETKAPAGYSMLSEPVVVKITDAGKEAGGEANGKGKLTIVSGQGTAEVDVENYNETIDLTVKIENSKGISLPETGAKTAMYCLYGGALLLVLGGLYFGMEKIFSRKRQ